MNSFDPCTLQRQAEIGPLDEQADARRHLRRGVTLAIATPALIVALMGVAAPALADDAQPAASQGVQTGMIAHVVAKIVDIDTTTNSVLVRGPRGNEVAVDVDPSVGDVNKLKVGDTVTIDYENALLIHADKVASNGIREKVETDATTPASGGQSTSVRMVDVIATVQKIDRKHRLVTLRGPEHTVVVQAPPDISIDHLKVGDSIRASFKSAAAVKVTRNGAAIN